MVRRVTLWDGCHHCGNVCTDSKHTALQNKTEDIKLRNDSAHLSPLQRQKDNEDLEDDGVHVFPHTELC